MEFIKAYSKSGESENSVFLDHQSKNKVQFSSLNKFFDQSNINLVCHKEFLSELDSGKVYCKVCSVNMDSISELSEHLQTKSHEDSIIMLIRNNLPLTLHKNMEFITFYNANLYCNLCKCNISWSSENPFKTIVDIVSHNESNDHLSKKTNSVKPQTVLHNNDESLIVLQSLAAVDSLLGDNITLIDYKVQPLFTCKLCKKVIEFEENKSQMLINFSLHLNSEGHKKCLKTYLVLKSFEESHLSKVESRHKFSVVKDRIICTCSSRSIQPSVESLLAHIKEKSDEGLGNVDLSSDRSSYILEEPCFSAKSFLSTPSLTDFSERFNEEIDPALFIKMVPPEPRKQVIENGESNSVHKSAALNNKNYEASNNLAQEVGSLITLHNYHNEGSSDGTYDLLGLQESMMAFNNYTPNQVSSSVYSVLNKLEKNDFFVSRVSKYLAKVNNQVMCDVCDAVICSSSDEKVLKDSIKHHFVGEKHKNFMEKLTFDEKETIVRLTFENATVQANKQYIKPSGKYLHCILCQFSLTLCLDHESLQKKLVSHCLGSYHLKEITKPYNSVFETRPLSSQSTSASIDDNPVKKLKTPIKRPGTEMKNQNSNKEGFSWPKPGNEEGKPHSSDAPSVDRKSLHNDPNAIKILNLVPDLPSKGLMSLVKSFGPLRHFYLSKDLKTGLCKGFALAHFQTRQSAERALDALNGLSTKYGTLSVKWAY